MLFVFNFVSGIRILNVELLRPRSGVPQTREWDRGAFEYLSCCLFFPYLPFRRVPFTNRLVSCVCRIADSRHYTLDRILTVTRQDARFLLFTVNSDNLRVAVLIGNIKFKSPFLQSRVGLEINLTCQYYGHVSKKQVCLTSISRRMISRNEIPHPLVAPTVDSIKYPAPLISALENR